MNIQIELFIESFLLSFKSEECSAQLFFVSKVRIATEKKQTWKANIVLWTSFINALPDTVQISLTQFNVAYYSIFIYESRDRTYSFDKIKKIIVSFSNSYLHLSLFPMHVHCVHRGAVVVAVVSLDLVLCIRYVLQQSCVCAFIFLFFSFCLILVL